VEEPEVVFSRRGSLLQSGLVLVELGGACAPFVAAFRDVQESMKPGQE
jgi:hypothetical protein